MQIKLAHLASPGTSAAAPGRAIGKELSGVDGSQAFGAELHDAMQGSENRPQESAPPRPQPANNAHAATPAVPAHVAEQARNEDQSKAEEEATATDAQLDGGLQAFVNSLQAPVAALAVVNAANTADATAATGGAATAAKGGAATAASSALAAITADADDATELAADADADGKGKAYAFGLDASHGARSRAQNGTALDGSGRDDAATAAGKDKVNARDAHASLRAQEVAASKVAPEFRAALHDAQAARPGLRDALAENGNSSGGGGSLGSGLAQAIAAAAAGAAAAASANATGVPGHTAHAAHITPHLHAAQWQDAFGQQVVWMTKNEQQIASLTMNPPELGPVRVTLSISDGQASAAFVSLQPEVRQAIQDAVPRLKEMLAEAGLQLQQASVNSGDGGGANREGTARAQGEDGARRTRGAGADTASDADDTGLAADAASLRTARSIAASRLVDLFA